MRANPVLYFSKMLGQRGRSLDLQPRDFTAGRPTCPTNDGLVMTTAAEKTDRAQWLRPMRAILFVALLGCLSLAAWPHLRDWLHRSPAPVVEAGPSEAAQPAATETTADEPAAAFVDPNKPVFNELTGTETSKATPVAVETRDVVDIDLPSPPQENKPGALTQLFSSAADELHRGSSHVTSRPLNQDRSAEALARLLASGAKRLVLAAESLKDEGNHPPKTQPAEASEPADAAVAPQPPRESQTTLIENPSDTGGTVRFLLGGESFTLKPGETISPTGPWPLVVRFHRGGEHGEARYSLRPGVYRFDVTRSGWELVTVDNGE